MLYVHATTYSSWVSQKENKNIGRSVISLLQKKTAIFTAIHMNTCFRLQKYQF